MRVEPARRSVVIGPASTELCRSVGPTSWAALVEMAQRSTGEDVMVTQVSIRDLASSLGLAKDTVARAVRRLRDARLVASDQTRSSAGVFDVGAYRLAVPSAAIAVAPRCQPPLARPGARSRRQVGQLALALED